MGITRATRSPCCFHPGENAFGRKTRKYNSILAGEASAAFSLAIGRKSGFDCRMIPLPNISKVKDYFFWRQEDASRNALNSWCYWTLRKEGSSAAKATELLSGQSNCVEE
jgi:tRNA(His) 5'-end guanylyltransferase